ncbi:MAG: [NiFe]-hydrogenase assembly chaperone HybE [Betaproteobacteria bacterium]|nr:[NiFe]-hydrogenase assembly chaperone HybE [Betaproteobacteria bacterium]
MTETAMTSPAPRLEAAFTRIWKTRMDGLPFVNAALRVEAVGFRPWQGEWLGALVTPWFVNLVLMPGDGEWMTLPVGGERFMALPAGRFRFIAGVDEELGEYHACSLFSPALEFADHETARATADAALEALFDSANAPGADGYQPSQAATPATISKRDFLRGRFSGAGDADRG